MTNPYTQDEYYIENQAGTWQGGYVEAVGYVAPLMMDGMDSWDGSGSSPYDDILNEILQALPSALSSLITSGDISVVFTESLDVPGKYIISTKTIYIRTDSINIHTIRHELLHAYQHKRGHVDGQSHMNNEYETYVINDIYFYINNITFATQTISSEHDSYTSYCNHIIGNTNRNTGKVNATPFINGIGNFFNAFLESHPGTVNSGYSWHWNELLTSLGLVESF